MILVAIDPGVKAAGVALFEDGELASAWLSRGKTWTETARAVRLAVENRLPLEIIRDCHAAIEKPQVYRTEFLKGDPNDLIDVALMAGAAVSGFDPKHVKSYLPKEWKGQVPKAVMTKRIKGWLSKEEHERVELPKAGTLRHNVWDAVGIGVQHLRLQRNRTT